MMGLESSGKRNRDPEDAVYVDNLLSHKRYLSEMMASSLNGLSVGESLVDSQRTSPSGFDPLDSPVISEAIGDSRDELWLPYSPMSEDSDDSRCCEPSFSNLMAPTDSFSRPTSPISPCRHHLRSAIGCSGTPNTASSLCIPSLMMGSSQQRQRNSDSDGRFPSSPSDICYSPDLRRAALLRSVQMKAQPQTHRPLAFDLPCGTRPTIQHFEEPNDHPCSFPKPPVDDERGYTFGPASRSSNSIEGLLLGDCLSMSILAKGRQPCEEKSHRRMNLRDDDGNGFIVSGEEACGGKEGCQVVEGQFLDVPKHVVDMPKHVVHTNEIQHKLVFD